MFNNKSHIGIDFSPVNTKIYLHNKGVIYNEPTIMYFDKELDKMLVGNQAQEDAIKNDKINLINPLLDALFVDLVKYCVEIVKKIKVKFYTKKVIILSFMIDLNDEEEEMIVKACKLKRKDHIIFVEPVLLEALGNNIDIGEMSKKFIVHLDPSFAIAAIISNNTINIREKLPVDGRYLDLSIRKYVKMTYNMDLNLEQANHIKKELVDLSDRLNKKISIQEIEIQSSELRSIMKEDIDRLCLKLLALIDVLSETTFNAIKDKGIYLIGEASIIPGFGPYLEKKLNIPVNVGSNLNNGLIDGMIQTFKNLK